MIVSAPPKKCPRCRGLMIIEDDWYGQFGTCVACGYVHEAQRCDPKDLEEEERLAAGKQRRRQPSCPSPRARTLVLMTSEIRVSQKKAGRQTLDRRCWRRWRTCLSETRRIFKRMSR